jgi:hypothetical protein
LAERFAAALADQAVNGPGEPSELGAATGRRLNQMDPDLGPQDDWTWTPPSR